MAATSTEGTGKGSVEKSHPRIQNNIKPENVRNLSPIPELTAFSGEILVGTLNPSDDDKESVIWAPSSSEYLGLWWGGQINTDQGYGPAVSITVGNHSLDDNLQGGSFSEDELQVNIDVDNNNWRFNVDATLSLPDLGTAPTSQGEIGSLTRNGNLLYFKSSSGWYPIGGMSFQSSLGNFTPTAIVSYTNSVVSLSVHQISQSDAGKLFLLDSLNGFITLPELSTTSIGQSFHFLTTVRHDQFFIQCYPFSDIMTGGLVLHKNATNDVRTFAATDTSNKIEYGTNNRTGGIIGSYVVATSLGSKYWIQGDVITSESQTPSMPFGTNS